MSGSLNMVLLIGNLGADPEIRRLESGQSVATFSLATGETWKDKNTGEKRERTEWHRVVCWNDGLVKVIEQYVRKGHKVHVQGELQTRKWTDQSGVERYGTEVVMTGFTSRLLMLNSAGGGYSDPNDNSSRPGNTAPADYGGGYGEQPKEPAPMDDEIPF